MNNEKILINNLVSTFNHSELRHQIIPMGMASGWPCIHMLGNTLCITIPYFSWSLAEDKKVLLHSIYCSVTVPVMTPNRLMDFTIYPYQRSWDDINHDGPVGTFPHKALEGVKRSEYKEMCRQLYDYYDELVDAIRNNRPFEQEEETKDLFSKLMEPALYPQYLRINKKFYSHFCSK